MGTSGYLAPLAHFGLVLIGLGEATYNNCSMSEKKALRLCGLSPLSLEAGEGLALLNGDSPRCMVPAEMRLNMR